MRYRVPLTKNDQPSSSIGPRTQGRASRADKAAAVDRKYVTALGRGLQVLRCFGSRDRWLANQEIALRTGLAKPTVTRLAYTLVRAGYLRTRSARELRALERGAQARLRRHGPDGRPPRGAGADAEARGIRPGRDPPLREGGPVDGPRRYLPESERVLRRDRSSRSHRLHVDRARLLLRAAREGATEAPRRAPRRACGSVAAAPEGVRPRRSRPSAARVLRGPRRVAAGGERSVGSARPCGGDQPSSSAAAAPRSSWTPASWKRRSARACSRSWATSAPRSQAPRRRLVAICETIFRLMK